MATTSALYRNPQPPIEQKESSLHRSPGQVAQTLDELIQLGFVEKFRDEHNIVRFKLAKGRVA